MTSSMLKSRTASNIIVESLANTKSAFDRSTRGLGAATAKCCREAACEMLPAVLMLVPVVVILGIVLMSIHAGLSIFMRMLPVFGTLLLMIVLAVAGKGTNDSQSADL